MRTIVLSAMAVVCALTGACAGEDVDGEGHPEVEESGLTTGMSASADTNAMFSITSWELRHDEKTGKRVVRGFGKNKDVRFHSIITLDKKKDTITVEFKTPRAATRKIVNGRLTGEPESSRAVEMLSAFTSDNQNVPEGYSAAVIDVLDCIGSSYGCVSPISVCRVIAAFTGADPAECCFAAATDCAQAAR